MQVGPLLAGMRPRCRKPDRCSYRIPTRHRHRELLKRPGVPAEKVAELQTQGSRWRDASCRSDVPRGRSARPRAGCEQYEESRRSSRSSAATSGRRAPSVENGNPLFWDDAAAEAITGGPIAPPTMVSVWFRPHHWAPGRTAASSAAAGPFRPEGAIRTPRGRHDRQHHRVPRAGPSRDLLRTHQVLRSVSEPEDDEARNRPVLGHRRRVPQPARRAGGVESYTGFGYRRGPVSAPSVRPR